MEKKVTGCFEKIEADPGTVIGVVEEIKTVPNETGLNKIGQNGMVEQIMMTEAIEVIESYSRNGTNGSIDRIDSKKWTDPIARNESIILTVRNDRIVPDGDEIDAMPHGLTARGSSEIAL